MYTYQDFLNSNSVEGFILELINNFKGSEFYENGVEARKYYEGNNINILARTPYFYSPTNGSLIEDKYRANNQVPSNFLGQIVDLQTSYLFANGVTLDDNIKDKLDKRIDLKLRDLGEKAQLDGISWGYVYLNNGKYNIDVWDGISFIPLYDELTSTLKAGVRFWQIDAKKPIYVELYEEDGRTTLRINKEKVEIIEEKRTYSIKKKVDSIGSIVTEMKNFGKLPIFPLKNNTKGASTFTTSLKRLIDLYDIILSDFGNNLEDSKDVYWVLKNYMGQDLGQFLAEFKENKVIQVDDDGDAKAETIEVPYQARETALSMIEQKIYKTAMSLDIGQLAGSSLTATAIKSLFVSLDLKTDQLERGALEFLEEILELMGVEANIDFIRRTIANDTETIDNLIKTYNSGLISRETALQKNPYVDDVIEELKRIETEDTEEYKLEDEEMTEIEDTEEKEENEEKKKVDELNG